MAELTPEQRHFLGEQKVPLSELFDASGMSKSGYVEAMRESGQNFAYGVTPCGKGGHTLRTRAGHCIQCDTSKIAYQLRHQNAGHVYLAGSPSTKLLKVGTTLDLRDREQKLTEYAYGGATDWEILVSGHCSGAGKVEYLAHRQLKDASVGGFYVRAGRRQACYELFRCGYDAAKKALLGAFPATTSAKLPREDRARHLWPD